MTDDKKTTGNPDISNSGDNSLETAVPDSSLPTANSAGADTSSVPTITNISPNRSSIGATSFRKFSSRPTTKKASSPVPKSPSAPPKQEVTSASSTPSKPLQKGMPASATSENAPASPTLRSDTSSLPSSKPATLISVEKSEKPRKDASPKKEKSKPKEKPRRRQTKAQRDEKHRASRRRNRQFIGFALTILIVVGAFSIVQGGISILTAWLDVSHQEEEYQTRFEPLVWFDILPFESISQVDENSLKEASLWGVLNQKGENVSRNDNGEALVTALEMDQYGISLFGPDFRFSGHTTFSVRDLVYTFDEETQVYAIPVTSMIPDYLATVVDITRESGSVHRVLVGYVSAYTQDNQVIATPDYENPVQYRDFLLRRDGSDYYLYSIENNTTYIPPASSSSVSVPVVPSSLPLEDSSVSVPSMPQESSVPASESVPSSTPDSAAE